MKQLRFALFAALSWMTLSVYGFLVIFGSWRSPLTAYYFGRQWGVITLWLCKKICGLSYQVEGQENVPEDVFVLFSKHSSAYETFALLEIFPPQSWVLKRELLSVPFFGWGMKALRAIAIDRKGGRAAVDQVIEQGRERFATGLCICIFPEGTRMPVGETRRYGVSGTILAQKNNKLIVPVAHNAGSYWPKGSFAIKPGVVKFAIAKPIDPTGRDPRELNAEIQDWVEAKVAELNNDKN